MKSIVYTHAGDPSVLTLVERTNPRPGPGEVRVKIIVSGLNPTDLKARQNTSAPPPATGQVPHQDGAGIIDALGDGVDGIHVGQRVWVWDAAWKRAEGTAQQYVVLPAEHVAPLADAASFDVGASLGIPALTAHRALVAHHDAPTELAPGALRGFGVLVAGGAGVVGHAAIQLAVWAGASVLATVSSDAKAELATLAGAHHVIDYRRQNVADAVRAIHPDGVDVIVEVNLGANILADLAALASNGVIAVYAADAGDTVAVPSLPSMLGNTRFQFVFTYLTPRPDKLASVRAVSAAAADGAMPVGAQHGLPIRHYPLERTADAHRDAESGQVGKLLIDVAE